MKSATKRQAEIEPSTQGETLSPEELFNITEYRRAADQRRWLDSHAWKYQIGRTGRPKVLRAERDRHMLGGSKPRIKSLNFAS